MLYANDGAIMSLAKRKTLLEFVCSALMCVLVTKDGAILYLVALPKNSAIKK